MCGDDAVEKITRKWSECVSNILYLGGMEVSGVKTEKDYFEAIKIIDRHLHPSGPLAKSPATFFLYEVNNDVAIYIIMVNKH